MIPTYGLIVHLFIMGGIAMFLCPRTPLVPLLCGLVLVVLYGDVASQPAVLTTFFAGSIVGAIDSYRDEYHGNG